MNEHIYDLLKKMPEISGGEAEKALDFALEQTVGNLETFTHDFKRAFSENGFYTPTGNVNWTTGFWTGQI